MSAGFILKNAEVVTSHGPVTADVLTRGEYIRELGEGLRRKSGEKEVDCSGLYLFPGLINGHDHLEFNLFPHLGNPPYQNAYEWGRDLHERWSAEIQSILKFSLRERLYWGAWKNLLSGVTWVVHHNEYYVHFRTRYPVRVAKPYSYAHSLGFEPNLKRALRRRKANAPFIIHLAEGIDEVSFEEIGQLRELGGLDHRTVAVHAIALKEENITILEEARASIVWCPSSNLFLFTKTLPIDQVWGRVDVALGTDSSLTGSSSLLDELRVAAEHSRLRPIDLFAMVTEVPRRIFHLPDCAGAVAEGGYADFFLLPKKDTDPYSQLLTAHPGDIYFLMRRGGIVFHDVEFMCGSFQRNGEATININDKTKVIHDHRFQRKMSALGNTLSHVTYLHR